MLYQLSLTIKSVHSQEEGGKNPDAYKFVIRTREVGTLISSYYTHRYTKVIL